MRLSRSTSFALLAATLIGSSVVGVAAQDADPAAGRPALATGQRFPSVVNDFTEVVESEGSLVERGRETHGRTEMSDPRLSGAVVIRDNADRWSEGNGESAVFLGDLLWGTVEVTNEGGTWTGTTVGTTDTTADGGGIGYYELVGSGGYEGMSAIVFEREVWDPDSRTGDYFWDAAIFPGALPPDR